MAKPKNAPQRRKGGQYSLGSIALTLLLIFLYWWSNGTQPKGTASEATQAPTAAAVATAPLPTIAQATTAAVAVETVVPSSSGASSAELPTETTTEPSNATPVAALMTATARPSPTQPPPSTATATMVRKPTATPMPSTRAGPPGMATITLDELPSEAIETVTLIEQGGPFPFSKDGTTFQNREGILPSMPRGYYSEYTVITPGENDRGARRIIAGEEGELYYTDDHYDSFAWILLP